MADEPKNTTISVTFPFKDLQVWQSFVVGLKKENRFTLAKEPARFIELVIDYAKEHKTTTLKRDTLLYRARINEGAENRKPFSLKHMGAPPAHLAGHGRLNPRGIPYLYLASDRITAVSEVRPWVGCNITMAEFTLNADCEFISFSKEHFVNIPKGKEYEGPEFTWRELIIWLFSTPFDPRDDTAYIPTQYLAERIKGAGFAGIIYDSELSSNGYNVTLFDINAATGVRREEAHVTSVEVKARFNNVKKDKEL